jgi:multidrug efflux pump subunit AcrA (membrane-fusion protein)
MLPVSAAEVADPALSDPAMTVTAAKRLCFGDTVQVTGVLVPRKEVQVRPEREGLHVSQILAAPGDSVGANQVLARLSPPEGQPGGNVVLQAPVAGLVTFSSAVLGATVSPQALPLFQIAERGEIDLLADTPVKNLQRLAANQPAKVEIIGIGQLSGKVRQIATTVNPTTQLGQVQISITSDGKLRVGAFGRAIVDLGQRCGPAVPLSAVLYSSGGAVVQVVRDNRVETHRVTVGLIAADQAEIREGLAEGDMVIARSGAFVRDGDRVRAMSSGEPRK